MITSSLRSLLAAETFGEDHRNVLELLAPDLVENGLWPHIRPLTITTLSNEILHLCNLGNEKIQRAVASLEKFNIDFTGKFIRMSGCNRIIKSDRYLDLLYSPTFDEPEIQQLKQYDRMLFTNSFWFANYLFLILPLKESFSFSQLLRRLNETTLQLMNYLVIVTSDDNKRYIIPNYRPRKGDDY